MNKHHKYLLGLLFSGAVLFTPAQSFAAEQALDQIAVVVNGDPVMRSEISSRMKFLQASAKQGSTLSAAQLQAAALDELVTERLQIQYAKKAGISIDDSIVDEAMLNIAKRNKMNLQTFQAALYRQGINYVQFREQTRNKLLIDRLRSQQARQQITISNTEISDLVSTQSDKLTAGARYRLAHSFTPVGDQASVAAINAARQQAYNLRKQTLAAGEAADTSNWQGDLSGWQPAEQLPVPVRRALALLEAGEISDVIGTAEGFHLLKLLETADAPVQSADNENKLRSQATQFLGERKSDEYYRAWLQSLQNSAYIDYRIKPAPERLQLQ
jgi:peptidyl-prolyl cis-trans isomerase SurA